MKNFIFFILLFLSFNTYSYNNLVKLENLKLDYSKHNNINSIGYYLLDKTQDIFKVNNVYLNKQKLIELIEIMSDAQNRDNRLGYVLPHEYIYKFNGIGIVKKIGFNYYLLGKFNKGEFTVNYLNKIIYVPVYLRTKNLYIVISKVDPNYIYSLETRPSKRGDYLFWNKVDFNYYIDNKGFIVVSGLDKELKKEAPFNKPADAYSLYRNIFNNGKDVLYRDGFYNILFNIKCVYYNYNPYDTDMYTDFNSKEYNDLGLKLKILKKIDNNTWKVKMTLEGLNDLFYY